MRNLRFFLLVFVASLACKMSFGQKVILHAYMENRHAPASSDTIYYSFQHPLEWSDFLGKPVPNYFAGAVTASGFAFDSHMSDDGHTLTLDIGIYTFFTKHDSWKKPEIHSAYHLEHEQHHFDITRIGAEDFLESLRKAKFTRYNYQKLLSDLFNSCYDRNIALQQQYDNETRHSLDEANQIKWNQKITSEVLSLQRQKQGDRFSGN